MTVSDLEKRVHEVFLKLRNMLEMMERLRRDKVALKVRLPGRLEELKKVLNDTSEQQKRVASDESEIALLRVQIDQECAEKLELKHKVRCLEKDMESCEGDIEELRADVEHQCDRYNELLKPMVNYL